MLTIGNPKVTNNYSIEQCQCNVACALVASVFVIIISL